MVKLEFVRGHVEVYRDGKFWFSADTRSWRRWRAPPEPVEHCALKQQSGLPGGWEPCPDEIHTKGCIIMVELNFVDGHVEVYKDGKFWFSADSQIEAKSELEAMDEAA